MPRARPQRTDHIGHEASSGDVQWVVDAYRQYFRSVWALLGRLGVPEASLEDVTQEVFLVLHRRRGEFRQDSSVRTWLHGIALHTARRHREKLDRRRRKAEALPPETEPPTPEAEVGQRLALQRLDRLLGQLHDEQREVFVLAEIAELSSPEIAELLGVKLNTVYSRLRLARRHLREGLHALPNAASAANAPGDDHGAA
ncbi:RNA polymerase sigma factor [Paraliomyxa miuraensis]|uniref:RNA polymerase sigma factor n=1 Tax=Paraliomyxa miuraensis TaxID=376150 RepID=UPI0022589FFD|nr:RNA polymerase sigma factor [Paraliomyxa miuraensis]MCX4248090.1 RNA polymerase sigma factor [Paraliomyxa miuraensis]